MTELFESKSKFIKEHFVTIFKLGNYSKIKAAFLESMLISKII